MIQKVQETTIIGAVCGKHQVKKSHRRYARAWVHPIPSDLPFPEALVIPDHSTKPSEFIFMSSNPANQPIEDQFLRLRQEITQEEQAKQIAKLRKHANRLQQENERLRTRLETNRGENSRGPIHPRPQLSQKRVKSPSSGEKVIPQQTMNYLMAALCSLTAHHPRTM